MNGTSSSVSSHSATCSRRMEGAKGRKDSRRLILALRMSFMSARRGSPRIERLPSARGPPLHPALKPTDHLAFADGFDGHSTPQTPRRAGEIAKAVHRQTDGFRERRDHCAWEDATRGVAANMREKAATRLAAARAGSRSLSQRV